MFSKNSAFFKQLTSIYPETEKKIDPWSKFVETFLPFIRKFNDSELLFRRLVHLYIQLLNRFARPNRAIDVVLCVDELVKVEQSLGRQHLAAILYLICSPLDSNPSYWTFASSLSPTMFNSICGIYDRTINFFFLPIPTADLSKTKLFNQFYDDLQASAPSFSVFKHNDVSDNRKRLDWWITFCAGNWRALEQLFINLRDSTGTWSDLLNQMSNNAVLMQYTQSITYELVCLALIGDPIHASEEVRGIPLSTHVANGTILDLNYLLKEDKSGPQFGQSINLIYPSMMLWQLFVWARSPTRANEPEKHKVDHIKKLLQNIVQLPEKYVEDGFGFEDFHCYWECLWRSIAPGVLPRYLNSDEAIMIQQKDVSTNPTSMHLKDAEQKVVLLKPKNFPLLDALTVDTVVTKRNQSSHQLLTLFSMKYTQYRSNLPTSQVKQSKLETSSNIGDSKSLPQQLKTFLDQNNHNRIVFCLFPRSDLTGSHLKHLSKDFGLDKKYHEKMKVIVVDAEGLKKSYGKALSSLLPFLFSSKNANQIE